MDRYCINCKHEYLPKGFDPCFSCIGTTELPHFDAKEPPIITNADCLRAMSDEELADIICDHACMLCPLETCDGRMSIGREACYKRWLDWLKQEVDE